MGRHNKYSIGAALLSTLCAFAATTAAASDTTYNAGKIDNPVLLASADGYIALGGTQKGTADAHDEGYFQVDGTVGAQYLIVSGSCGGYNTNANIFFTNGSTLNLSLNGGAANPAMNWNPSNKATNTISFLVKNDGDTATVNFTASDATVAPVYSGDNYASKWVVGKGITVNAANNFSIAGNSANTRAAAEIDGNINVGNQFNNYDAIININAGARLSAKKLVANEKSRLNVAGTLALSNAGQDVGYSQRIIQVKDGGKLEFNATTFTTTYYMIFDKGSSVDGTLGKLILKRNGHIEVNPDAKIDFSKTLVTVEESAAHDKSISVNKGGELKIGVLGFSSNANMTTKITLWNNSTLVLGSLDSGDVNIGTLSDKYMLDITLSENASLLLLDYSAERDDAKLKYITVNGSSENLAWVKTTFEGADAWKLSTAVPEPAEWAAIFGAVALALAAYRRRKIAFHSR